MQALVQNTGDELDYKQGDPVKAYMPAEALRVLTDTGVAPVDADRRRAGRAGRGKGVRAQRQRLS